MALKCQKCVRSVRSVKCLHITTLCILTWVHGVACEGVIDIAGGQNGSACTYECLCMAVRVVQPARLVLVSQCPARQQQVASCYSSMPDTGQGRPSHGLVRTCQQQRHVSPKLGSHHVRT